MTATGRELNADSRPAQFLMSHENSLFYRDTFINSATHLWYDILVRQRYQTKQYEDGLVQKQRCCRSKDRQVIPIFSQIH